jgi:hypothetical protein
MTASELLEMRAAAGRDYGEAVKSLLDAMVRLAALDIACVNTEVQARGGPGHVHGFDAGVFGAMRDLPRTLEHYEFSPRHHRWLNQEIRELVEPLVESVTATAPAAA